jgi:hypothetical protein
MKGSSRYTGKAQATLQESPIGHQGGAISLLNLPEHGREQLQGCAARWHGGLLLLQQADLSCRWENIRRGLLQGGRFELQHRRAGAKDCDHMVCAGLQPTGPGARLAADALRLKAQREARPLLESVQELSELVVADAKRAGIAPM